MSHPRKAVLITAQGAVRLSSYRFEHTLPR
jgi:hypothetical protein